MKTTLIALTAKGRAKRALVIAAALSIGAIVLAGGAALLFPHFVRVDFTVRRQSRALSPADPAEIARHYLGSAAGCENILPLAGTSILYASDLEGSLTLFDGPSRAELKSVATRKLGDFALGLALDRNGRLLAAASEGGFEGWKEGRSRIIAMETDLEPIASIPAPFPCVNGICVDGSGALYIASSDFDFAFPSGAVYRASSGDLEAALAAAAKGSSEPIPLHAEELLRGGLFNGIIALENGSILAADTMNAVYRIDPNGRPGPAASAPLAYRKSAFAEAFDDLCVDSRGRLWLSDPIHPGGVSVYDPTVRELRRVEIPDFGTASSCRIRVEKGREILYVSEIRAPGGSGYDGRGIVSFPIDALR